MGDEVLYSDATNEFAAGNADKGLLAKARYLARGDEETTEFEYIKLRVEQIKSQNSANYIGKNFYAGHVLVPALGRLAWHLVTTLFYAILIVGFILLILGGWG